MFKISDIYKVINSLELEFGDVGIEKITLENNNLRIEFKTDSDNDIKSIAVYK